MHKYSYKPSVFLMFTPPPIWLRGLRQTDKAYRSLHLCKAAHPAAGEV